MKARAYVVNPSFLDETPTELKIQIPNSERLNNWGLSFIDLLSDTMQTEIGDYAFLWVTATDTVPNHFLGIYRIISSPFLDITEPNFIKIKIEPAYIFNNYVKEYDIINSPNSKDLLWNIIGKKVKGKKRGTTPLSKYETEYLLQSLIDKNPEFEYIPPNRTIINLSNQLNNFNFSRTGINLNAEGINVSDIILNNILHRAGNKFKWEKSMELLFNWLLKNRNPLLTEQLNINIDKISWFANYLPYGIEQGEIDYMITLSDDGVNDTQNFIIEFMKDNLDEKHLVKATKYAKWVNDSVYRGKSISKPIVICKKLPQNHSFLSNPEYDICDVYGYDFIDETGIKFNKLR